MKKLFLTLCLATSYSIAQTGLSRNAEGFRVPSANILGQGFLYVSGNYENLSDGEPLAMDGIHNLETGKRTEIGKNTPSSSGGIQLGYGLFDFLEVGAYQPIYYDGAVKGTDFDEFGFGDMQLYAKASLPMSYFIQPAASLEIFVPSANKQAGFRPRHIWYIPKDQNSYAYTAGDWAAATTLYLSLDLFNIIKWNNYAGYLANAGEGPNAILWGTGLNIFPNKLLTAIVEASGETRIQTTSQDVDPLKDPLRISAALQLHLPQKTNITFGVDLGVDYFKSADKDNGHKVIRKTSDTKAEYLVPGSPKVAMGITLTKTLDFSSKDSDRDGVPDRLDMCPNSARGVIVNARGCPVDQDQDGVMNIVDDCPNTPLGVRVDFYGCPLDEDKDGVPDYMDKCPATPAGIAVTADGCMLDSDGDGVDDNNDKCPDTIKGDKVDAQGCSLDEDHDGVLNEDDSCPGTPAGWKVNTFGCPLDDDNDGIPNEMDQCPQTEKGESVSKDGCPIDTDEDGVPDSHDKCPATPKGYPVDKDGCPTDDDKDGIANAIDKCPGTPAGAIVDSLGCILDSDWDGVADYLDKCPGTLPDIPVESNGCAKDSKFNLIAIAKRVSFFKGSDKLIASSFTALNDIILMLRQHNFNLEVSGTATQTASVAEFFKNKGFNEDRIKIVIQNSPIQFKAIDVDYGK